MGGYVFLCLVIQISKPFVVTVMLSFLALSAWEGVKFREMGQGMSWLVIWVISLANPDIQLLGCLKGSF